MDRLYTCFVSSTFLDLRAERELLARVLLRNQCMPLGMEFFPSMGRRQWELIEESMDAADFCVFLVGGRYGTISDESPLSWTHREFRLAVERRKPISAVLHAAPQSLPLDRSEPESAGREQLAAFRREIEAHTQCEYWRTDTDLVNAVSTSVRALRESAGLGGWVRASQQDMLVTASDAERTYELLELDYAFHVSTGRPDTLDAVYHGRREITVNGGEGVQYIPLNFTRTNERHLPFSSDTAPTLHLASLKRSGVGTGVLDREPRKRYGSNFVQDVVFRPPLAPGERLDFVVVGQLPSYKYRYRDQILAATADAPGGPRTFEWTSRQVSLPTQRLVIRVFLAESTGAQPYGPLVGRGPVSDDRRLSAELQRSGSYRVRESDRDGVRGVEMELDVDAPRLLWRYRLAWQPPVRP